MAKISIFYKNTRAESDEYLIALDVSLNSTGYAIFTYDNQLVECGIIDASGITTRHPEMWGEKLAYIMRAYRDIRKKYNITTLAIEKSFIKFNKAAESVQRATAIADLMFMDCNLFIIPPMSVKLMVTGRGSSTKAVVCAKVNDEYGLTLGEKENDISDAIAVGMCFFDRERYEEILNAKKSKKKKKENKE